MEDRMEEGGMGQSATEGKVPASKAITVKLNIRTIALVVAVVVIAFALYYFKGLYVVALVNGSPVSRLSLIKELEKQSGKQVLDSLITKKLIESEASKKNILVAKDEVDGEIKKIEDQLAKQGGTLQAALAQQGVTESQLRDQIGLQKKIEKILGDKIAVNDTEVDTYIKDNKTVPAKDEKPEDMKIRIKDQLKQEKFSKEAAPWVTALKSSAKIQYFVNY